MGVPLTHLSTPAPTGRRSSMDESFYVISNKKILLENNCIVTDRPSVRIYFLDTLSQLANIGKYATQPEYVTIEQIVGEVIKIQTEFANNRILRNFTLNLEQGELI